jgi:hypothetical protein
MKTLYTYGGSKFNNPGSNEQITPEGLESVASDTKNTTTDSQ